jgi:hypothetical protein
MSSCQRSFGCSAANRCQLLFGRLWGCGVTNPRADRIRQIVDPPAPRRGRGVAVELLAQGDDLVLDGLGCALGAFARPPGPGHQPSVALGQEPLNELDHPAAGHPVGAGDLALGPAFDQHRGDHQLRHPHRSPLRLGCERCPATAVNDVLNSDTAVGTQVRTHFSRPTAVRGRQSCCNLCHKPR